MGTYLNPGNALFRIALNSQIFVDKSRLIEVTNRCAGTMQRFICVSRPRRFGKSMAADMLAAYYQRGEDSDTLFQTLKIADCASYAVHRNKYDVIKVNMQEFLSATQSVEEMLDMLRKYLLFDLQEAFSGVRLRDEQNLVQVMKDIYAATGHSFVILIDEWDCLFREYQNDKEAQKKYLDFLRAWLKDKEYVALAYMTGILPIKKLKTQSALNNFEEFTMLDAGRMAPYVGFTEEEVHDLCDRYGQIYEQVKLWYDGYSLEGYQVYNPKAVVSLMLNGKYKSYWSNTGSYEAIVPLINMNFDGLRAAIIEMMSGAAVDVDVTSFQNDTVSFANRDDVLTYLIHLGYLAYDQDREQVFIPNEEIRHELNNAVKRNKWNEMITFQKESADLLDATLDMDEKAVADGIERIHQEYSTLIHYNYENSLSSVLTIEYLR